MRSGLYILLTSIVFGIVGCKDGDCYYTCCVNEDDCMSECVSGIRNAEKCAYKAQRDCMEGDGGYLIRVQWAEVNEAICPDCDSPACAPSWWKDNLAAEYESEATDTAESP